MNPLALSAKLFAGAIIHIAVEEAGVSDLVTRPIAASAKWLELLGSNSATPKPTKVSEIGDYVGPDGWEEHKDEYTVADVFEVKGRYTTALHEQLFWGLAGPIVQGTPQTIFAVSDRKLRGWINIQQRMQNGQDRLVASIFCEIRAMDPPPWEKKTQEPTFEFRHIKSTLRSINFPT